MNINEYYIRYITVRQFKHLCNNNNFLPLHRIRTLFPNVTPGIYIFNKCHLYFIVRSPCVPMRS